MQIVSVNCDASLDPGKRCVCHQIMQHENNEAIPQSRCRLAPLSHSLSNSNGAICVFMLHKVASIFMPRGQQINEGITDVKLPQSGKKFAAVDTVECTTEINANLAPP